MQLLPVQFILRLQQNFCKILQSKYPTTKVYSYEIFGDSNRRTAWQETYGTDALPSIDWSKADTILSLESDFLGKEGNVVENMREFSGRRDVMRGTDFNRLYCAEGTMSLTGMNADYRLRVRPDKQLEFVLSLLNEIVNNRFASEIQLSSSAASLISKYDLKKFVNENSLNEKYVQFLVDDLIHSKGKGIVYGGETLSIDTHKAINLLNEVLGNNTLYKTGSYTVPQIKHSSVDEIKQLISKMNNGNVGAVIHFDTKSDLSVAF
ncbi:MAG: hypothetical protein U5K00_03230 [Melioribacteraceae bacterium]|nr:hypothetical protein [Melioribacteraceae bacterium]